MISAMLWDVDGTLAETERDGHLQAFNLAFSSLGVPWRWSTERYGELLAVAGGRERLLHDMQSQSQAPADRREREALAERIHRLKNRLYADIVARGDLSLRPGVRELLQDCAQASVRVGIVTTTSRSNVEALLDMHLGPDWESTFAVVICAEDAPKKKPDPQAYLLALDALQVLPHETVAIEDAPAGVAAAQAAGVPVIVARSHYFNSVPCAGVLAAGPSLGRIEAWNPPADPRVSRIDLAQINRWHSHRRRALTAAARPED
ncbi:MAG: HAD-IA family hydrolase [Gammaproteobacteria bacterium]